MGAEVLTVKISSVQAVALAFVTYFIGLWIKNRVPVFQKLSLPAAVIGGLPFAFILSGLRVYGILQVDFDNTLSTVALLVFLYHHQYDGQLKTHQIRWLSSHLILNCIFHSRFCSEPLGYVHCRCHGH